MAPSEGRSKEEKVTLEVPVTEGTRRGSIAGRRGSIMARRMSVSERKYSTTDSLPGRSLTSAGRERMTIRLENTYKMEPDERFPIFKAKKLADEVMAEKLQNKVYHAEDCTRMSLDISDSIKQRIKAQCCPARFKVVVIVAIGQAQESQPSVSFTSRCIWNDKVDNYAESVFANRDLYAVALVYAMYAD